MGATYGYTSSTPICCPTAGWNYCSAKFAKPKAVPPFVLVLSLNSIFNVGTPATLIRNSSVGKESGVNRAVYRALPSPDIVSCVSKLVSLYDLIRTTLPVSDV